MSINTVPTITSMIRQSADYFGIPYAIQPNTTLNQKLSIFPDEVLTQDDAIRSRYLVIGNGGHDFTISASKKKKWKSVDHTRKHTGLYNQLPFVLRKVDEDLTPTEQAMYRLRRLETHLGERYVAYYGRVLDLAQTVVRAEERHIDEGVTTTKPYVPALEDLSPVPDILSTGQEVTTTGDYVAVSSLVTFTMTGAEVQEFLTAAKIIEGEDGLATISELAVVSGVDRQLQGDFNGQMKSYTELVAAQIMAHIPTAFVMDYMTLGFSVNLDAGNVEPLLSVG